MVTTSVDLTDDNLKRLHYYCAKYNVSMKRVLNQLVKEHLRLKEKNKGV